MISFVLVWIYCDYSMSADSCPSSPSDSAASNDAYKSAMIALAVIAGIAIVIIILMAVYIVKRLSTNGLYSDCLLYTSPSPRDS